MDRMPIPDSVCEPRWRRRRSYKKRAAKRGEVVRNSAVLQVTLAVAALAASGCIALRPYADVAAALPAEQLVEVDGRRVHVEIGGDGSPLLLLHGFGGSTFSWRRVSEGLAGLRRVVAIDLNGFGWTERPHDPEAYTLAGQERLVLGVADRLGLPRFDLAGHSYGGGLALFLAARHPERVRSLILVDAAMPAYGTLRRSELFANRAVARFWAKSFALTRRRVRSGLRESYADDAKVDAGLVRAYLERLRVEGAGDAFYGLSRPTGAAPDQVDLAAIRQPTLLVWGGADALIAAAVGRKSAGVIPSAQFVEIPGCGHIPMEECPEAFLAAVEPFLASRN